jgi:STE24 endopeptidase
MRFSSLIAVLLFVLVTMAIAQEGPGAKPLTAMPDVVTVPPEAQPSDHFDVEAATNAYLAKIPQAARARSDAYFEGGYWLILWDFLVAVIIYWALLRFRWSARMRNLAERLTRFPALQTFLYWVQFMVLTFALGFLLTYYEGFVREHKYGLATQTFLPWMGDQLKLLLIGIVIGGIAVVALVAIVRRSPRTWHIWGAIVSTVLLVIFVMIAPVFLFPLFNNFKPLDDPKITQPILSMARANGIAVDKVYVVDASQQSTRISANVSGLGKTMRITLNDNLLKRASLEETEETMGHEMGHYVLNHVYKDMLFAFIVIVAGFGLLRWGLYWSVARWGMQWGLRDATDIAALPVVFLLGSIFFFVLTPILNTQTRTAELEADMYGLNASRQPDGSAQSAIHLGEYRKMSPGPIEEWIFYDHPSGRERIHNAMRWKAENLVLFKKSAEQ